MRERRESRWSFIRRRRLRSTAMWFMRWLSTSSLFLVGLVRFLFLLSLVIIIVEDLEKGIVIFGTVWGRVLHGIEEPE